jgi:PAS domain S-box-containing protein
MDIVNYEISLEVTGVLLLVGTAAVFFHKKVTVPLLQWFKGWAVMKKQIEKIYIEMGPNGGATIKDAITRIEMRLVGVEQKQNVYLLEAPHGLFEANVEGRVTGANRTLCSLVGRQENEMKGFGWINSVAPHDRDRVVSKWEKSIEEKMEYHDAFDFRHKDGKIIPVNAVAYAMENPTSHEIIGWLGTITKNSNAEVSRLLSND